MANIFDYSTTAGNNTAVGGVSIAEGMAPGDVNNGMRAIMADLAAYIALTGGAKVTTGSSGAYAVASTGLSLTAYANGLLIAVRANHTNTTGNVTLNLDGLGAKDVKVMGIGGIDDPAANQIRNTGIYLFAYSTTNNALMLLNPSLGSMSALDADDAGAITGTTLTGETSVIGGDGTEATSATQVRALGDAVAGIRIETSNTGSGFLHFRNATTNDGSIEYDHGDDKFKITSGGTEVVYISGTGFIVGEDALIDPTAATDGCSLAADGLATFQRVADVPLRVSRRGDDGTLVQFYQGGSVEGIISVSGNTVTYGSFCGVHWSQVDGDILRGTVMESIDGLCTWDGETNQHLPKCKVSDTPGSTSVYGVWLSRDEDGDALIASLGAYLVRVRGDVARGDLLESAGDGTARKQRGKAITSSTIGKVTAAVPAETYPDGSWLVPAVLYCG